jgi:hypothetical protein
VADGREALGRDAGVPRLGEPSRAGLDDHHREVVGDDVVQVARDPRALTLHREPHERLLLGLELAGPDGQLAHDLATPADLHSAPPRRQRPDGDLEVGKLGEADVHLDGRRQRHRGQQAGPNGRVGAAGVAEDDRQHELERRRSAIAGQQGDEHGGDAGSGHGVRAPDEDRGADRRADGDDERRVVGPGARQQFDESGADEGDGQRELGPPAGRGQRPHVRHRPPPAGVRAGSGAREPACRR